MSPNIDECGQFLISFLSDIPVFKKGEFLINNKEYMLGSALKVVLVPVLLIILTIVNNNLLILLCRSFYSL